MLQDVKFAICAPSHNSVGLYLRNKAIYRQSEKNWLKSNIFSTRLHGELRPTNGWHRLARLGHASKFQRVSHLRFVTAPTSLNGGQPNFARCLAIF